MRSLKGKWRANYSPKLKQRTALLRKLKDIFRGFDSQPVGRVVQLINLDLTRFGRRCGAWFSVLV